MAKRMQEQKRDNRIVSKSKPTTMNVAVSVSTSSSIVNSPIASKRPGQAQGNLTQELSIDAASSSQGWQKDDWTEVQGNLSRQREDQEHLNYLEDSVGTGKLVAPGYQGYPGTPGTPGDSGDSGDSEAEGNDKD